jgi:D-alanine-D-alanine ligase
VLAGGPDAERAVSIMSGTEIASALEKTGQFAVMLHTIDRLTIDELGAIEADVFFPALHGPWGEGGPLQELLEADGRPFVGSGSVAARAAMDKVRTKEIAIAHGITTPAYSVVYDTNPTCDIAPPVVLKPIDDGSSVDVLICPSKKKLTASLAQLLKTRKRILVEKFVPGRELTVGIVHGRIGSVIEIQPSTEFYDYKAKYERDDTAYVVGPELPPAIDAQIRRDSLALFEAIGCRDLARIDFRLDDVSEPGHVGLWMLEINTMPGFTTHSLVPMGEAAGGVPMGELCASLVRNALSRGTRCRAPSRPTHA